MHSLTLKLAIHYDMRDMRMFWKYVFLARVIKDGGTILFHTQLPAQDIVVVGNGKSEFFLSVEMKLIAPRSMEWNSLMTMTMETSSFTMI